jgi:hypothetical protein
MKYLKLFEAFRFSPELKKEEIKKLRGLNKERKEMAQKLVQFITHAKSGKVHGLRLHPALTKRLRLEELPAGFSMGLDKDGWFIHTHRARSESREDVTGFTKKEIKFIDSTG